MPDEFAGRRGSDIPHAGYQTAREKATSDAIMFFLRGLERNRPLLLLIVLDGRDKFIRVAKAAWRGLLVDRDLLGRTYDWLAEQAGENPAQQLLTLRQQQDFAQTTSWDHRQRTADALRKAQHGEQVDLQYEQMKPRKVYSH